MRRGGLQSSIPHTEGGWASSAPRPSGRLHGLFSTTQRRCWSLRHVMRPVIRWMHRASPT